MPTYKISIEHRETKVNEMLIAHGKSPLDIAHSFEERNPQCRVVLFENPKEEDFVKLKHFHSDSAHIAKTMRNVPWEIEKIINVSNELATTGETAASISEQIAAAFVLNDLQYIPNDYSMVEAWERLGGEWQGYVKSIQHGYGDLIAI